MTGKNSSPDVTCANFDEDTNYDPAAVGLASHGNRKVFLPPCNGEGTFDIAVNPGARDSPYSVMSAGLDGDGGPDLAIGSSSGSDVPVLLDDGLPPVAGDNPSYRIKEDQTLRVGSPGILGNDTDPDADALTVKDADPSVPVHTASERSEQREADARHRRLIQLQAQAQLPRHRLHQLHSDPRRKRQQRRRRDDQGPVRARVDRRKVDLWHAPHRGMLQRVK